MGLFNKNKEQVEEQPQISEIDIKNKEIEELQKEIMYWKEAYNLMSVNHTHEMYANAKKSMAFTELLNIVDVDRLSENLYELFQYKKNPLWLKEYEEEKRKREESLRKQGEGRVQREDQ